MSLTRHGVLLVGAGGLLLLGFGLWLVGSEDVGYGDRLGHCRDRAVPPRRRARLARRAAPEAARLLAAELAERGEPASPELRALLDDPLSRTANYTSAVLVLAILALMVFKP